MDLLNIIRCPGCDQSGFRVKTAEVRGAEIREGTLTCDHCQSDFPIKRGIIYLFKKLSLEAEAEISALKEEISKNDLRFQDERWLLNFPDNDRLGVDERAERITRLNSENILAALPGMIRGEGLDILEIGAGNCWVTARLAEKHHCVALDIFTDHPKGLESGDVFIAGRGIYFERLKADMFDLPFKNNSFDIVFISSTLHHSPDLVKTLQAIKKLLKENGRVCLLNEPVQGFFGKERKKIQAEREAGFNEKRYSLGRWKKAFSAAGFDFKISLPANFSSVVKSRGRLASFFSLIFLKEGAPKKAEGLSFIILTMFDGFFNAALSKRF